MIGPDSERLRAAGKWHGALKRVVVSRRNLVAFRIMTIVNEPNDLWSNMLLECRLHFSL